MIRELFIVHVKLAIGRVSPWIGIILNAIFRLLAGRLCEEVILYTPNLGSTTTGANGKLDAPSTGALMNTFSDDAKAAKDKGTVDNTNDYTYNNYDYDYSKAAERSFSLVFISLTVFIF